MNFGNLEGLVNGTEQVVFDYEVTGSAVSSISTGNILNGDEDGLYTIILRPVSITGEALVYLRFNGDTGSNYGRRSIQAVNSTVADASSSGDAQIYCADADIGNSGFSVCQVYAKSGAVRRVNILRVTNINGTTVSSINTGGHVWNNTNDNIINMSFSTSGNYLNVGSRVIILKSNNFTNGTPTGIITTPYIKGAWVRVGSTVLGSAASSVTFSGLDGNRDVLYFLSAQFKSAGGGTILVRPNNDSGSNYGEQRLYAASTTVGADRSTSQTSFSTGYCDAGSKYSKFDALIFAKSGFLRPAITTALQSISGTTITAMHIRGAGWNNTADNITSLVLVNDGGSYIDTGSQFDLYALRPNG